MVKIVFIPETEEPKKDGITELIDKVNHWADERNLISKKKTSKRENQLVVATVLLLISLGINIATVVSVLNRPVQAVVVHKADNATVLHGKITGKEMIGKLYTLDCGPYGKFLVSKEQYDSVNVGDDIPSYLKGRGQ